MTKFLRVIFVFLISSSVFAMDGDVGLEYQDGDSSLTGMDGNGTRVNGYFMFPAGQWQGEFLASYLYSDTSDSVPGFNVDSEANELRIGVGGFKRMNSGLFIGGRFQVLRGDAEFTTDSAFIGDTDLDVEGYQLSLWSGKSIKDFNLNGVLMLGNYDVEVSNNSNIPGAANVAFIDDDDPSGIVFGGQLFPSGLSQLMIFAELGFMDTEGIALGAGYKFVNTPVSLNLSVMDLDNTGSVILLSARYHFNSNKGGIRQEFERTGWRSKILGEF